MIRRLAAMVALLTLAGLIIGLVTAPPTSRTTRTSGSVMAVAMSANLNSIQIAGPSPNLVCGSGPGTCYSVWKFNGGPYAVNVNQYEATHGYWTPNWQGAAIGCLAGITVDGAWQGYWWLKAVQAGAAPELSLGEFAFQCIGGSVFAVFFTG